MPEGVRIDDQYRDSTGSVISGQHADQTLNLDKDEVAVTDPTTQTKVKTYTVAAQGAAVDLAATPAITIDEDTATVTAVTYTPAGAQAAPASGNSRTWTLAGTEGTIASFTESSVSSAFVSGTPVSFTINHAGVTEETLTLASVHVSAGFADPGGTLKVTYTY